MKTFDERSKTTDDRTDATVRMTVQEAADAFGVTVEAIRGRMHRGKYLKEKDAEGRVWVLLSPDQLANGRSEVRERSSDRSGTSSSERSDERSDEHPRTGVTPEPGRLDVAESELIEELRGEVSYLKEIVATRDEEIRRRDHIIMALTERVPELEASRNGQEYAREPRQNGVVEDREEPERRSWWRRLFDY